jgi:hypothetical protein
MENNKMKKHVTVVAILHVCFGIFGLIGAIAAYFALCFAMGFVAGEEIPGLVLSLLSIIVPLLVGFMSALGLIGGIGLFYHQAWARYLVLVVAVLGCLNIPIGTLKGAYSIWVLLQDETIALFG